MKKILIFGTTDLAEVLMYHLKRDERYGLTAFVVDKEYLDCGSMGGVSHCCI